MINVIHYIYFRLGVNLIFPYSLSKHFIEQKTIDFRVLLSFENVLIQDYFLFLHLETSTLKLVVYHHNLPRTSSSNEIKNI